MIDLFLDLRGRPPIEDDPQFSAWGDTLPRQWFNEQRRTMQTNDTELFGSTVYATFIVEQSSDTISAPSDVQTFGPSGLLSIAVDDISGISDGAEAIYAFSEVAGESIPLTESAIGVSPYGMAIVRPVVDEIP